MQVSAFAEMLKPRILRIKTEFFRKLVGQKMEQSSIFMKKQSLSFEKLIKTCVRGVKTRVLGTLISLKIWKRGLNDALARVFGGSKRVQKIKKK